MEPVKYGVLIRLISPMDGSIWVLKPNVLPGISNGVCLFLFKSSKTRSFMFGLMLPLAISQLLLICFKKATRRGGRIKKWNSINLWVRTMFPSILSSSLQLWLLPSKVGHCCTTFRPLNTSTTRVESLVKLTELECLVIMLFSLRRIFLVRYGDTTWLWIGLRRVIPNFVGKTLLIKTTTNCLQILVIWFTVLCNLFISSTTTKFLR